MRGEHFVQATKKPTQSQKADLKLFLRTVELKEEEGIFHSIADLNYMCCFNTRGRRMVSYVAGAEPTEQQLVCAWRQVIELIVDLDTLHRRIS